MNLLRCQSCDRSKSPGCFYTSEVTATGYCEWCKTCYDRRSPINRPALRPTKHRTEFEPPFLIYFAVCPRQNIVKIGRSSHVQKRLFELQLMAPDTYIGATVIESDKNNELVLRRRFSEDHYTRECYHLTDNIKSYMESLNMESEGV